MARKAKPKDPATTTAPAAPKKRGRPQKYEKTEERFKVYRQSKKALNAEKIDKAKTLVKTAQALSIGEARQIGDEMILETLKQGLQIFSTTADILKSSTLENEKKSIRDLFQVLNYRYNLDGSRAENPQKRGRKKKEEGQPTTEENSSATQN